MTTTDIATSVGTNIALEALQILASKNNFIRGVSMSKSTFRVSPQQTRWGSSKRVNLLMKEYDGSGSYLTMWFVLGIGENRHEAVKKIQNDMDIEVLDFLRDEKAAGYQLIDFDSGRVAIHVLYSREDEDENCDNKVLI